MSPASGSPGGTGRPATSSPSAQNAFDSALDAHDRGQALKAEELYRQAIAADSNMTIAHNNLGMVLIEADRLDEAVASLRRAIVLDAGYAEAYNNLGFALRKQGRDNDAADAYEQFLKLVPDVEEAAKIRGWITKVRAAAPAPEAAVASPVPGLPTTDNRKPTTEQTILEAPPPEVILPVGLPAELIPLTPADGELPAELPADAAAEAALKTQAEGEAAAFFSEAGAGGPGAADAAKDLPPNLEGLYTEAMNKFQDGQMEEAAKLAQAVLDKVPGHFHTLVLMGRAELGRLDFTRATTFFQKAAEARPNDPEAQFFLGQSYEKRGLLEEAQGAYKRCVELAPEGPRAKRLAKWLERGQAAGKVIGGAARCDFCLRAVPEQDLTIYDERRACKNCLESLGAHGPAKKLKKATQVFEPIKTARRKGSKVGLLIVLGLVVILAVAVAGAWAAGVHKRQPVRGWLISLGLAKPPPKPPPPKRIIKPAGPVKIYPESLALGPVGDQALAPLAALELEVPLKIAWPGGAVTPPAGAEPVKLELVEKPEGLKLNEVSVRLSWTPGLDAPVELPSAHKVRLRASCGEKIAEAAFEIKVDYPLGRPRETDLGLAQTHRAVAAGLVLADLDGDDRPDLAAASGTAGSGTLALLLSRGAVGGQEFVTVRNFELGSAPVGLSALDLDGDGRTDLGWVDWASGKLCLLRGAGGGSMPSRVEPLGAVGRFTESLVLADLAGGGGRRHFVAANRPESRLRACAVDGPELAEAALSEMGAPPVLFALLAKPAADGKPGPQLVALARSGGTKPGELVIYGLDSKDRKKWDVVQKLDLPAGLVVAGVGGNFDGAFKQVAVLVFGGDHGGLAVLESAAPGKFALKPAGQVGELPLAAAAGDVNGDGRADLVVSSAGGLRVLLSTGQGSFLPVGRLPAPDLAGPVALWGVRGKSPARAAALTLRGRVLLLELPAPRVRPSGG